jgi:hypothetical protein
VDDQADGDGKEQSERERDENHLIAVAVEFCGERIHGAGRKWSPAGGAETPAFDWLSAVATIRHFCSRIRCKRGRGTRLGKAFS